MRSAPILVVHVVASLDKALYLSRDRRLQRNKQTTTTTNNLKFFQPVQYKDSIETNLEPENWSSVRESNRYMSAS